MARRARGVTRQLWSPHREPDAEGGDAQVKNSRPGAIVEPAVYTEWQRVRPVAVLGQQARARAVQLPGTGPPPPASGTRGNDLPMTPVHLYECTPAGKRGQLGHGCGPAGARFSLSGRNSGLWGSHLKASRESPPAKQARCSGEQARRSDAGKSQTGPRRGSRFREPRPSPPCPGGHEPRWRRPPSPSSALRGGARDSDSQQSGLVR